MSDTATKPAKTRKPNIGSDPSKGGRVRWWQVGLYAFGIGMALVLIGINVAYILDGRFSSIFAVVALLVIGLSWQLLTVKADQNDEPDGLNVGTAELELSQFIGDIAERVGAPMPDSVHLVASADFGLTESTRHFGRSVESSTLTIGLPYLHAFTRQEFAAMVAYELALYSDNGVDSGAEAYRSLRAASDLIAQERKGFVNGVFGSYARKMFRGVGGVGVAQEESADSIASQTYGKSELGAALSKYDDVTVAFDQLLRDYVVPALQNQRHPIDMFAGFEQVLTSETRKQERAEDVERRHNKERNEFDLHLSARERLARIDNLPTGAELTVSNADEPAHTLLDTEAKSADIVVGRWASKLIAHSTTPSTWQELTEQVYVAKNGSLASMVFDEDTNPADQLEQTFAWAEAGDWSQVDSPVEACLKKKVKDPVERRAKWARCVVTEAAAATGEFRWEHNWHGPPALVDGAGNALDTAEIAEALVEGDADRARQLFTVAVSS